MNKLKFLVMAILLLIQYNYVLAQEVVTPTPNAVVTPDGGIVTPTPDGSCQVNFFSMTRLNVSQRYYQYQQKGGLYSLSGATGDVTLLSENYAFTVYFGKVNLTTGAYNIVSQATVEVFAPYTFTVNTLTSPQMIVVFDCVSDVVNIQPIGSTGTFNFDTSCVSTVRVKVGSVNLPAMYTFGEVYVMPILDTEATVNITSTLYIDALIGEWFDDTEAGTVVRGIREGNQTYQSSLVGTQYTVTAPIKTGYAALITVTCP